MENDSSSTFVRNSAIALTVLAGAALLISRITDKDNEFYALATSIPPSTPLGTFFPTQQLSPEIPQITPIPQNNFDIILPDGTVARHTGRTKINGLTGAIYNVVDYSGLPGQECVSIGRYSKADKQDLDGALVALGPDTSSYVDVGQTRAYWAGGGSTGFTRDELPENEEYKLVYQNTIVCSLD